MAPMTYSTTHSPTRWPARSAARRPGRALRRLVAPVALTAIALAPVVLSAPSAAAAPAGTTYTLPLDVLNNSRAYGKAQVTLTGTTLHVVVDSHNLVPKSPHAQHLHGDLSGTVFRCPNAAEQKKADANADGMLSTTELATFYGPILYSLTTSGDVSPASGLAVDRFPVADAAGDLHYERTFTVSAAAAKNLKNLHIVQHGVDYNGNHHYDGMAMSDLDPKLPAEATDPSDCGHLSAAQVSRTPTGGVETGTSDAAGLPHGQLAALSAGALSLAALAFALLFVTDRRRRATVTGSGR